MFDKANHLCYLYSNLVRSTAVLRIRFTLIWIWINLFSSRQIRIRLFTLIHIRIWLCFHADLYSALFSCGPGSGFVFMWTRIQLCFHADQLSCTSNFVFFGPGSRSVFLGIRILLIVMPICTTGLQILHGFKLSLHCSKVSLQK